MTLLQWLAERTGYILGQDAWSALGLDILWSWMPDDIQAWIAVFIVVLFVLAIKRAITS